MYERRKREGGFNFMNKKNNKKYLFKKKEN